MSTKPSQRQARAAALRVIAETLEEADTGGALLARAVAAGLVRADDAEERQAFQRAVTAHARFVTGSAKSADYAAKRQPPRFHKGQWVRVEGGEEVLRVKERWYVMPNFGYRYSLERPSTAGDTRDGTRYWWAGDYLEGALTEAQAPAQAEEAGTR